MKLKQRTIYYQDELHDEFAGDHIKAKHIGQDYRYIRVRLLERMLHGFWYRIVAVPLARLYMKLHFSHKIINKEVLKQAGNSGFYLYGNHTHFLADALIPTLVNHPRETAVIVHPNNVSMPVLGRITPYLGALPLPDDRGAMKHFLEALSNEWKINAYLDILLAGSGEEIAQFFMDKRKEVADIEQRMDGYQRGVLEEIRKDCRG